MENNKSNIKVCVENLKERLWRINDYIHENPELGNEEFKAVDMITSTLKEFDFEIEKEVCGLPTAFQATYQVGQGGPVIGLLCEYDALEGMGHGCGHNLQSPSIIGAAIALVKSVDLEAVTIKVIGTPAEETDSGKITMTKHGLFDNLDVALMMHGGDRTTVDGHSLASEVVDFSFEGKEAHAAVAPEQGISALDGVLLMFNAIEYLREHVRSDVRMHGIITNGGSAYNIVPAKASAKFSIRALDRPYLEEVLERVYNVARGSALATGSSVKINSVKSLKNKLNIQSLNDVLLENAEFAGGQNITPPRERTGSTDFGVVSHQVPGACLRVSFVPFGTSNHTTEWVEAGKSEEGYDAILVAAKALAGTCYDLLHDKEKMDFIKKEFQLAKQGESVDKQKVSINMKEGD